jgi:cytochrome b subunit of formate dehydrogenase
VNQPPSRTRSLLRIGGKVLYWLVVLAISLALVVGLILFFESRDQSQVEEGGALPGPPQAVIPA